MKLLPDKYSKKWLLFFAALFLLSFIPFICLSQMLNFSVVGVGILSLIVALVISIGGYLEAKVYFLTASVFDIIGIIYMLYIALNKTAEGWSDLVSIISYLFIVGIGIVLGVVIQVIMFFISKRKS